MQLLLLLLLYNYFCFITYLNDYIKTLLINIYLNRALYYNSSILNREKKRKCLFKRLVYKTKLYHNFKVQIKKKKE